MKLDTNKFEKVLADKGLMLKDLCDKAELAEVTLRNIRQGKRTPRPATLGRIAKALGVDVQDIIQEGD